MCISNDPYTCHSVFSFTKWFCVCLCVSDVVRGADHVYLQSCAPSFRKDERTCHTLTLHNGAFTFSSSAPSLVYSSFRIELHSKKNKFDAFHHTNDLFRFIHFGDNIVFHVLRNSPVILDSSANAKDTKYLTFGVLSSVNPCIFQLVHPYENVDEEEEWDHTYEHEHVFLRWDSFMLRLVVDSSSSSSSSSQQTTTKSYLGLLTDQKPHRVGVTDKAHALIMTFGDAGIICMRRCNVEMMYVHSLSCLDRFAAIMCLLW